MTAPVQTPITSATANGVTTVFPYTFKIEDDEDIGVKVDNVEQTSGFTVSGVGQVSGGNVTFSVAPTNGDVVIIYRKLRLLREQDYQQFGDWNADNVNPDFDRLWLMMQVVDAVSLRVAPGDSASGNMMLPANRFGKYINFDEDNQPILVEGTGTATDAALVSTTHTATGGVQRNLKEKLRTDLTSVTDFTGVVADGTTDNTATILDAAVNSGKKTFIIPPNVKYDRASLLSQATLPDDVVFIDFSGINDFSAAGESTKHFGVVSKDSAPDDTHWSVDSGHHAVVNLNNFGTAGTTSATNRLASLLWSVGQFALGAADKRGFRGAAIQQFRKESGGDFWSWGVRLLAPWLSIAGRYERWASGQVISGAGVYRENDDKHYVSTGAGTTGATPPTHSSGTSSDGGVSWTYLDSADRSIFLVDQYGRWLIGNGALGSTFTHKVAPTDPSGNYVMDLRATGTSKRVSIKGYPTNSSNNEVSMPFLFWQDDVGLRFMASDGLTDIARVSDAGGFAIQEFRSLSSAAADGDTTPSVDKIGSLLLSNTGATSITTLDDASDDQIVHLVFTNGNTTLVHSVTFMLTGSVNVTPTTYSVVTMRKIPASISDRWVELSRSIK